MQSLARALLVLETEKECEAFLRDVLTPQEYRAVSERWEIAQLLSEGELSYREIARKLGASVTTVTRVARFLKDEPYLGYKTVLDRLKNV